VSEIEPAPRRVLVPREPLVIDEDVSAGPDSERLARWLRANWVLVPGVLLVGAQTGWMANLLAHSYFKLDDFELVERAADSKVTWQYLMRINAGHLTPLGNLIAWVLTRISPYNWSVISAVTLVLLAGLGLMVLRALRTLFGDDVRIFPLFAVYLLSPLLFPGLSWWVVAIEIVPFTLAMFGALTSHIHFLRTGHRRHVAATVAWLLLGMASSDKGLAVPLLLFAITSAYLAGGSWRHGAWTTLREHWRVWALYGALMLGYVAVYLAQLGTSSQTPGLSGLGAVFTYIWTLVHSTFIPGILGGPWRWFAVGDYGLASPPAFLMWLAVAVAFAVFAVSIGFRLRAWRAWAILAAWLVVVDTIPVLLGRAEIFSGHFLGLETRYVMETPGLVAILVGLAFLPVAQPGPVGQPAAAAWPTAAAARPAAGRRAMSPPVTAAIVGLLTVVLIGSVWSFHTYVANTTSGVGRSYIATARLALAQAPAGTVIASVPVPADVLGGLLTGSPDQTGQVMAPLVPPGSSLRFSTEPAGTIDHLMQFDGWGRLVPAQILGTASFPRQASQSCWAHSPGGAVVVILQGLPSRSSELRIGYLSGTSGNVEVTYAGQTQVLALRPGLNSAFLPVSGSGTIVTIAGGIASQLCVGDVEIGVLQPSTTGPAIPALAVTG
jgi:hypothetical protein